MLRDHLIAFADGQCDRFIIICEEIPLVAAWFCVRGIVGYSLREVEVDGEGLYEVYRDRWRVQFGVAVPELLP
ncbi:hypothetical protein BM613_13375 [Sulfoacidibacillus thermotolerans]|uniref:Uncharacterized protein n=2 Tax=Sulfoacidibacillus thermotolerans TaxID=1765684 RepID=A0A2U3D1N7_SULT2|nr:hypothetical protein BM613_13375 [Sulfoacidibacillus thermotolerans]